MNKNKRNDGGLKETAGTREKDMEFDKELLARLISYGLIITKMVDRVRSSRFWIRLQSGF